MTCRTGPLFTPRRVAPTSRRAPRNKRSWRMSFEATIAAFARALADPALPPPEGALGRQGRPDARRFAVYRNNVAVGLTRALEARFPVTRRLVGDDFFRAAAGAFLAVHKPRDAVLVRFGAEFPEF